MIELGKTQALRVLRIKDVGVYLGEPGNEKVSVLLPKRQVPEGTKIGNMLDVFISGIPRTGSSPPGRLRSWKWARWRSWRSAR